MIEEVEDPAQTRPLDYPLGTRRSSAGRAGVAAGTRRSALGLWRAKRMPGDQPHRRTHPYHFSLFGLSPGVYPYRQNGQRHRSPDSRQTSS